MNCKTVSRMLSGYIDNEAGAKASQEIASHVETCPGCKEELSELLKERETLLKQAGRIEPSAMFRTSLLRKISSYESSRLSNAPSPVFRWLPVPVGVSFFLILFSVFSFISPAIYGGNLSAAAAGTYVKYSTGSVFAPVNFAKFCDKCANSLCECCQNKPGAKCACKK